MLSELRSWRPPRYSPPYLARLRRRKTGAAPKHHRTRMRRSRVRDARTSVGCDFLSTEDIADGISRVAVSRSDLPLPQPADPRPIAHCTQRHATGPGCRVAPQMLGSLDRCRRGANSGLACGISRFPIEDDESESHPPTGGCADGFFRLRPQTAEARIRRRTGGRIVG